MVLSELKTGESAIITKINGRGEFRKRITEMAFIKGQVVHVIKNAPLKDPVEYSLLGYEISLRRSEAEQIEVELIENDTKNEDKQLKQHGRRRLYKHRQHHFRHLRQIEDEANYTNHGTFKRKRRIRHPISNTNEIKIAFVGNPNSGKTTLFNSITGSREHVGNYAGVTVDIKKASLKKYDYNFNLTDLPGTYSIAAYSPEEIFVRENILKDKPDIVVNVVDASNLERNLFLTTQLIDMDIKVVIALNIYDELEKSDKTLDYEQLGKMIGIPIIPTIGKKGTGINYLLKKIIEVYEDNDPYVRHVHINYGEDIENSILSIQKEIWEDKSFTDKFSSRFFAIKLLEKDKQAKKEIQNTSNSEGILNETKKQTEHLERILNEDTQNHLTDIKYGFIKGALKATYTPKKNKEPIIPKSLNIDKLLTHKYLGFPIFLGFLWIMFQSTFFLGSFPMEWIESGISLLSQYLGAILSDSWFKDLLIDGIIAGVGGVLVFLPNILILFLFISIMEDTGYMARVAFIMDKLMHLIGLHGKSFIPMIMGFGCNVPAIMATRTIENRNDRLLTMLMIPFMSCSARLPIYILIAGAIFPENPGTAIFLIYLAGIVMSVISAMIFNKTLFRKKEVPFVMELPPYRTPTVFSVILHMWRKGQEYLKKMGGIILYASVLIWVLGYFPQNVNYDKDYDKIKKAIKSQYKKQEEQKKENIIKIEEKKYEELKALEIERQSEQKEKSLIGRLGNFVQPIVDPLGFDWKMSVSLLTGIAAKEVVVSTMGVLYSGGETASLEHKIRSETYSSGPMKGNIVFTIPTAIAFMLFVLLYVPCVAVIAAIKKESGGWKWAIGMVVYNTSIAWFVAFIGKHLAMLFI